MESSSRSKSSSKASDNGLGLNATFYAGRHRYGQLTATGQARLHQGDHFGHVVNHYPKDEEVAKALDKEKSKRRRLQRDLESLRGDREERAEYQQLVDEQLHLLQSTERDKRRKLERKIEKLLRSREEQAARQAHVDEQLESLRAAIDKAKQNEKSLQKKLDKAIVRRVPAEVPIEPSESNVQHWTYRSSSTVMDHRWVYCLTMCGSYYYFSGVKWNAWL